MTIAKKINEMMTKSSWIRKMFEEGARLKAEHGADKVFDFSLGNPNLPPPEKFNEILRDTVDSCGLGDHCYMPQAGFPQVCVSIADYLTREQGLAITCDEIIMTCGAAGALNVIFKALLDPGDEVLSPAPCFVEYGFYADNHGGVLKMVNTRPDFTLDLEAMGDAITAKTKIVLINSPNNPTGQIYDKASLDALGQLLSQKSEAFGHIIYLISDEPYRKIVFDGADVPSIFQSYDQSIIATSYSKDISIPGERIGFAALNPATTHKKEVMAGMALANRILGFVNAPALMQRVVAGMQGMSVDIAEYQRKRDLFCDGLADAGYDFITPTGAFYLFPRTPIADDVAFVTALQKELILVVPGSGFAGPGHFRIAFCVDDQTIVNSLPGFKKVMQQYK
ncbi:pyridoxal phosphate-dependent aminotransferase [Desulfosarcina ovata]|uniref:Aminotransferase n=2 Tax=Desulfosarcina ovata TaxID=83564 RepID=A0A5K8AEC8_9BACT|nr:pyridoxal phosphate-dependent aminotransferase [Desulfosarcina ovata]BBO84335.1 aspartate aminotransferase [Desulfosarcina ovata subsp. sediminis]BBO90848.1 aspartate aminotransferase [Desulfosarcina ovata subsp. ovata]